MDPQTTNHKATGGNLNSTSNSRSALRRSAAAAAIALLVVSTGCLPEEMSADGGSLLEIVPSANATVYESGVSDDQDDATTAGETTTLNGSVYGEGDYELFDLGNALAGEEITVSARQSGSASTTLIVTLFDADYNLLNRRVINAGTPLRHIVRQGTPNVYVGVTPSTGTGGDAYTLDVAWRAAGAVPQPESQTVYLDFGAGQSVSIGSRSAISYSAFDGAMIDARYAEDTQTIKNAIVEAMREDYAVYDVTILSSDDDAPPQGAYSTIHFGGSEEGLLGLADNVDRYNESKTQNAAVYIYNFAPYAVMDLDAEDMGVMIGNVASHELGHLLGLYHTTNTDAVMDTTGTAWDLAVDQSFARGELLASVFPMGFEDSPQRIAETVGSAPASKQYQKRAWTAKSERWAKLRAVVQAEMEYGCGLCLELDK